MGLRIATRGSPLAMWQALHVQRELGRLGDIESELMVIETEGDLDLSRPIAELAGRGVFVKEVQAAVLDRRADLAVHSAKDLTSTPTEGLVLAAVLERGDPRDALAGAGLDALASGATVGTGSVRRQAQLAHLRPDLVFVGLRGNIGTRLSKLGELDAIVVAAAALERLGLQHQMAGVMEPDQMVPQVGQGAVAVECRSADSETAQLLASINHPETERAVSAERAYLGELGGGCDLPVGAYAVLDSEDRIVLTALMAAHDGAVVIREEAVGDDPLEVGVRLARILRDERGGMELLEASAGLDS